MMRPLLVIIFISAIALAQGRKQSGNPNIDMSYHLEMARAAAAHRANRLVSEEEFIRMSKGPNTIVLDARSREKYDEMHVKGAINLSFPDIDIASLERLIPNKETRILIYCNNNFRGAERPFPAKLPAAALNLSTYTTLYIYGYRNVYELEPLIEIGKSKLEFEGTLVR
ncbi:MAG: rhodanese-like domain-containing protein [Acidobacteriota bacterium]|nr:rhodanese-like domain-containing protein [Blastocatellia bacterium]MDW8412775.1 rhodanese-like domain-containing protein [Acidobacteriota bacterium]